MLRGIAASKGIGIGTAVIIQPQQIEVTKRQVLYLEEEKQRFLDGVEVFIENLGRSQETVKRRLGESEAAILGAQIAIMRDPEMIKEVLRIIEREKVNAEYAFHLICNGYIALFSNLEDELLAARAADFRDIRDRMLRILLGIDETDLATLPAGSIVVADDIPPSQAAGLDLERISGILTRKGTRFSHISIIARALRLPAVVAIEDLFERVSGGETLVLDGHAGCAWINPDAETCAEYHIRLQAARRQQQELSTYKNKPTHTRDGAVVRLAANLAVEQELSNISEAGADAIGLLRTEFLFMERSTPPSEQEQYTLYRRVAADMGGKSVTIRTLDIGGDKAVPYLLQKPEDNPFLGYRALRFCLERPDIFKPQLAAILRAAACGSVQLLLPLVSSVSELRAVKMQLEEVKSSLTQRGEAFCADIAIGVMIETPAAVLCAEDLASESDFFSIGTNDLTQYLLAVDRGNSSVAALYEPMHPSVLRAIAMAVQAAKLADIPVCVCGESAADPLMIPFLIGLGVDELSVSSGDLLAVRRQISHTNLAEWRERAQEMLTFKTAGKVKHYVIRNLPPEA